MSRRRIEAGVNAGSSFSLRAMTDGTATGMMAPVSAVRKPALSPPNVPAHAGLSFKFNQPIGSGPVPVAMAAPSVPPPLPMAMANPFAAPQIGGVPKTQEVMRLTAASDDLRSRLKQATDRIGTLEGQLNHSQRCLQKERHDAHQQVAAVRQEVATVRDSELKLRSELASRPTVCEFKQNKFQDAVRTAMEAEEMAARVAESSEKFAILTKKSQALHAEVKLLESSRTQMLEATAANSKAMFTEEQISEKVVALAKTEAQISAAEDRLAVIMDDSSKLSALRDSHKSDSVKAEFELVAANEALVAAVSDLTATKQERGEMLLQVTEMKSELASIQAGITDSASMAVATSDVQPALSHSLVVTGEMPPNTKMGFPTDSSTRRIDAMGCSGCGVPYHFGTDAPITIGAMSESHGGSPIDEMVKAVVSDLKGYLTFAAEENARRGIAHGVATGDAAAAIEVM